MTSTRPIVLAALLAGCAAHEPPTPAPEPSARANLARSLDLELPDCTGPDRPLGGRAIWVALDAIHVVDGDGDALTDRSVAPLVAGNDGAVQDNHMIGGLYDAIAGEDPRRTAGFRIDVVADRRVPMNTLLDVLYTAGRAGGVGFTFACGSVDRPSALAIAPRTFGAFQSDPPRITAIRSDLALMWDATGVRAWALPRPAEHPPFPTREEDIVDSVQPPPRKLPDRVPLVLREGADPPLSPADVAQLSAALCRFNDAPFGVELDPDSSTPYPEFLATAVAATSRCGGPRQLFFLVDPESRAGAVTVDLLRNLGR